MQAIVCPAYGSPDILELREVATPAPKDDELLIKVHAASTNAYDWHILRADPFLVRLNRGFFKPKNPIPGADVAGVVEAVGKDVNQFKPGDAVYGELSAVGDGAFAEYVCMPERFAAPKPATLSFEEAAAVPMAAVTALQALRDVCQVQPGQQVLINGASGGVGTFAVQIAKTLGADVTAVCSTNKVALAHKLGADHVIDYKKKDFARSDTRYDVILGIGGYRPLKEYVNALKPGGIYAMVGGTNQQIFQALLLGAFRSREGKKVTTVTETPNQGDLLYLNELMEAGAVRPVIDRCYPLAETADAIRYMEEGHAKGKVVITVVEENRG